MNGNVTEMTERISYEEKKRATHGMQRYRHDHIDTSAVRPHSRRANWGASSAVEISPTQAKPEGSPFASSCGGHY